MFVAAQNERPDRDTIRALATKSLENLRLRQRYRLVWILAMVELGGLVMLGAWIVLLKRG